MVDDNVTRVSGVVASGVVPVSGVVPTGVTHVSGCGTCFWRNSAFPLV